LRSLEVWKEHQQIEIPQQIRSLIERTYEERATEPISWQTLFEEGFGKALALKQQALQSSNMWSISLEDDEGVQTRINELPTISLVLCKKLSKLTTEFIDGEIVALAGEEFCLKTAQAIHRNLVKVPSHHFEMTKDEQTIARYLRGSHRIGLVAEDGFILIKGLKSRITLYWSQDLGIVIEKAGIKEE
jgi:CRISPR-associated endonuclease/helicase Cas3